MPTVDDGCIGTLCLANESGPVARYFLEHYKVRQLTNGSRGVVNADFQGGLFAWQTGSPFKTSAGQVIVAFDFETNRLVPVDVEETHHRTLPVVYDHLVAFKRTPGQSDPMTQGAPEAGLWDYETRQTRSLDLGLGGGTAAMAIEGDWVLVRVAFPNNESDDGVWAHNLEDGRKLQVYKSVPDSALPANTSATLVGSVLSSGRAYSVHLQSDYVRYLQNSTITEVDLGTGNSRLLYWKQGQINNIDGAESGVLWEESTYGTAQTNLVYYNQSMQEPVGLTNTAWAAFARIEGEWAAFRGGHSAQDRSIVAYHIPTRRAFQVIHVDSSFGVSEPATNGIQVVFEIRMLGTPPNRWQGSEVFVRNLDDFLKDPGGGS